MGKTTRGRLIFRFAWRVLLVAALFVAAFPPARLMLLDERGAPVGPPAQVGEVVNLAEEFNHQEGTASVDVSEVPAAAPAPPPPTPTPVPPSQRNALIIGINHAAGTTPLPGSITDARYMESALLRYGFPRENVTVLLEGEATRERMLQEIDNLARRSSDRGLSVFAVASHTRKNNGVNELATADGGRISAFELGERLNAVRGRMWVALPTCYAGGYAVRGIVGPNRIATFASSSATVTYQLGEAGSYLIRYMVRKAMLEGGAPHSIEQAFRFAVEELRRDAPNRIPIMSDGVDDELSLGPVTWRKTYVPAGVSQQAVGVPSQPYKAPPQEVEAKPIPGVYKSPTPAPRSGVCGSFSINCR